MSNVFLFDTRTERDSFIMGSDYTIPHVSGLVDSEEITYNNRLVPFLNKIATYHNDDELVAEECRKAVELSKNNLNFEKCILIQRVPITETQTDPDTQEEIEVETGCDYEYVEINCPTTEITRTMISDYISTVVAAILPTKIITLAQACFQDASNLRYINLDNITSFAAFCFLNCSNLSMKILFSNNLINILERSFMGTNITFNDVITCSNTIHLSAFQNNRSISNLTLNAASVNIRGNCGNGTGTLTVNAPNIWGQNTNNFSNEKAFEHIILNGNVSLGAYVIIAQGCFNNNCLKSISINGNLTFSGNVGVISYGGGSYVVNNLNFVELTGTYTRGGYTSSYFFFTDNNRSMGANCMLHLSYNGVAGIPGAIKASNSRIKKIYVGDGSSLENDQAVLDMYLADTDWATYSSKLDCWYNYTGEYKNG